MAQAIEYKDLRMEGGGEEAALQIVQGKIAGYAMVYGNVDDVGDRAWMGCAAKSVAVASGMPVGWQHDIKNPLGVTLDAAEHPRSQLPSFITKRYPDATGGLWVKGQAVMTPDNQQRMEMVVAGPVKGLSVGYIPKQFDFTSEDGATIRNLRWIDWKEWSPVTIGANPAALMTDVKSLPSADLETTIVRAVVAAMNQHQKGLDEFEAAMAEAFLEVKAGRMLSAASMDKIRGACDGIGGGHKLLTELMGLAEEAAARHKTGDGEETSAGGTAKAFERLLRARKWRMDNLTYGRL